MEDKKKKHSKLPTLLTLQVEFSFNSISPPCVFIDQGGKSRMFNLFDHLMGTVKFLGGANKWKKENTLIF